MQLRPLATWFFLTRKLFSLIEKLRATLARQLRPLAMQFLLVKKLFSLVKNLRAPDAM
jgi:hypothetical protein